jgi:indole-3-glycerol phosphate synthase|tara:strand:+ start:2372 stop:3157 length:786 start_codon:yes stop_codon:yes gene_type:complete
MNILEKIVNEIQIDLIDKKKLLPIESLEKNINYNSDFPNFYDVLNNDFVSLIAELKDTSPSKGKLMKGKNFNNLAKTYLDANVNAVSVVTEKNFFKGSLDNIINFKKLNEYNSTPVLRKDFIIDKYQIYESKFYGADAILLIASILSQKQLNDFVLLAKKIDLECLVEVHNLNELEKALTTPARIIGINNRNLNDFSVDINTTLNLIKNIPDHVLKVSESGIFNKNDISVLGNVGCNAVLIGEAIITSDDPYKKIIELTND